MSLGIWKKIAALLCVLCISVALNGCGPAAETPTPGAAPSADSAEEETTEETTEDESEETTEDDSESEETESEGASIE